MILSNMYHTIHLSFVDKMHTLHRSSPNDQLSPRVLLSVLYLSAIPGSMSTFCESYLSDCRISYYAVSIDDLQANRM